MEWQFKKLQCTGWSKIDPSGNQVQIKIKRKFQKFT